MGYAMSKSVGYCPLHSALAVKTSTVPTAANVNSETEPGVGIFRSISQTLIQKSDTSNSFFCYIGLLLTRDWIFFHYLFIVFRGRRISSSCSVNLRRPTKVGFRIHYRLLLSHVTRSATRTTTIHQKLNRLSTTESLWNSINMSLRSLCWRKWKQHHGSLAWTH